LENQPISSLKKNVIFGVMWGVCLQRPGCRHTGRVDGDRSAKIRTYNFPQSRITDHRINYTVHRLDQVLQGEMDDIIDALHDFYRLEALDKKASSPNKVSK